MTPKPHCHECDHVEINPTGPMICTVAMYVLPTRIMRQEGYDCGPEGVLFEPARKEYERG